MKADLLVGAHATHHLSSPAFAERRAMVGGLLAFSGLGRLTARRLAATTDRVDIRAASCRSAARHRDRLRAGPQGRIVGVDTTSLYPAEALKRQRPTSATCARSRQREFSR